MSNKRYLGALITTFSLLITTTAQAHTLTAEAISGLAGMMHPLLGLDHLLAMLAVGLWAAQQGGSRLWQLPLAFLSMMLFGAVLGQSGFTLPSIESGIASSLLLLGLMLMLAIRLAIVPSMLMVGLFAMSHGYAHGTEMPQALTLIDYAVGFMLATAALHGLGIGLGLFARGVHNEKILRISGIAISLTGAWLWT
ncbi:MAG: HupE/UreJ family protein [Methylococcaceae bacterium]